MTAPALGVDADLRFAVDDAGRRASGTVTSAEGTVTITVDRPWTALRALQQADLPGGRSRGRSDLAPVAESLSAVGLRVVVVGPNGTLLTMGRDVRSSLGRLAAGSPRVAVRPRAVLGIRRTAVGIVVVGLAGSLLAAALVGRRSGQGPR